MVLTSQKTFETIIKAAHRKDDNPLIHAHSDVHIMITHRERLDQVNSGQPFLHSLTTLNDTQLFGRRQDII